MAKFEKELDVVRFVKMMKAVRLSLRTVFAKPNLPSNIQSEVNSNMSLQSNDSRRRVDSFDKQRNIRTTTDDSLQYTLKNSPGSDRFQSIDHIRRNHNNDGVLSER